MTTYIFDVDGTLTDSRQPIDPDFEREFYQWSRHRPVYLVTGSDYPKTLEQVGRRLCESVTGVYNCAGNQLHRGGQREWSQEWQLTEREQGYLAALLATSTWPIRTGQHIEDRGSLVNFSTLGRGADRSQRELYRAWDHSTGERRKLAVLIEQGCERLTATVAGETGIDLYPRGWDKSQLADQFVDIVFFGDRTEPGGNDHTLAQRSGRVHTVANWQETRAILRQHYSE